MKPCYASSHGSKKPRPACAFDAIKEGRVGFFLLFFLIHFYEKIPASLLRSDRWGWGTLMITRWTMIREPSFHFLSDPADPLMSPNPKEINTLTNRTLGEEAKPRCYANGYQSPSLNLSGRPRTGLALCSCRGIFKRM